MGVRVIGLKLIRNFCWHFDRRRKYPEKVLVNADHQISSNAILFRLHNLYSYLYDIEQEAFTYSRLGNEPLVSN